LDQTKMKYAAYRAAGVCVQCGKESTADGRVRCRTCLEYNNQWRKDYIRRAGGKVHRIRKAYEQKMVNEGRCVACSGPLREEDAGYVRCINCREGSTRKRGV